MTTDNIEVAEPRLNRLRLASGIELHYVSHGQGEPVILVHGGMGDLQSWSAQIRAFAHAYRVISYSRRYSFPNRNAFRGDNHSVFIEADDLAALLQALRLPSVHLVGTSYGAFAALAYAVEYPRTVRSLVLAEPPVHQWARGSSDGDAAFREFIDNVWTPATRAFELGLARNAMRLLFDGMGGQSLFDTSVPALVASVMRNARSMEALTRSAGAFPDLSRARVRLLNVRTLLVSGQYSIALHKLVNAELARMLPNCEQAIVPDAGHSSPRENPVAFNAVVLEFMARQRQRA